MCCLLLISQDDPDPPFPPPTQFPPSLLDRNLYNGQGVLYIILLPDPPHRTIPLPGGSGTVVAVVM